MKVEQVADLVQSASRQGRWTAWLDDLFLVFLLLGLGWSTWPSGGGGDLPFWATLHDQLVSGPDAGAWASGARALAAGRLEALEAHRMPTWIVLTAAMHKVYPVALAGHFVNHGLQLLLPVVVYGVGRLSGGRVVGFGAGILVACCPPLVAASRRFGVDPAVGFFVVLMVLACLLVAKRWRWSPLAGAVAALASATHFTTLGFGVAGLFAMLLLGVGWRRWAQTAGYLLGFALVWMALFSVFPWAGFSGLFLAIPEGITPGEFALDAAPEAVWGPSLEIMKANASTAAEDAVAGMMRLLRPGWLPWGLGIFVLWLGVPGFELEEPAPDTRGWRRWWASCSWKKGLILLVCLAPLPVLAAASAEPRYSQNLLPVVAILLMRGCVSLARILERILCATPLGGWWPAGVLPLVLGLGLSLGYRAETNVSSAQQPPPMFGTVAMRIGNMVGEHFPEPGGLVCDLREAVIYTARDYCPRTVCPQTVHPATFSTCLAIMGAECTGEGPLPYVVLDRGAADERTEARLAFDSWVLNRWSQVADVKVGGFEARLVAIPREELPSLAGP